MFHHTCEENIQQSSKRFEPWSRLVLVSFPSIYLYFSSLSVFFIFLVPKDYTLHDHSKGLVKLWKDKITITSTVWVEGRHK